MDGVTQQNAHLVDQTSSAAAALDALAGDAEAAAAEGLTAGDKETQRLADLALVGADLAGVVAGALRDDPKPVDGRLDRPLLAPVAGALVLLVPADHVDLPRERVQAGALGVVQARLAEPDF